MSGMEIFGTAIATIPIIIDFVKSYCEFDDDAISLAARLAWDLRALRVINDYFKKREDINGNHHLSDEDQALLEQISSYLGSFVDKIQQSLRRIKGKGLFRRTFNRATWMLKRPDVQELERQLRHWTQRFGVRVLGLPDEFRLAIRTEENCDDEAEPPDVVKSGDRLKEFVTLAKAKTNRSHSMILKEPDDLIFAIEHAGDLSIHPVEYCGKQLILSSRKVSDSVRRESQEFTTLTAEMGDLTAALNCLDPTTTNIQLLRVEYYLYDEHHHRFLFAQIPPYEVSSMMTLTDLIHSNPFPTTGTALNQRFVLAHKIAEAVFFLHTAGFLHKNITSSSIVLLRRLTQQHGSSPLIGDVDKAFLMGFDLIRESEAITYKEGVAQHDLNITRSIWDFDIFQHPDRLQGENIPRYINTYDVYSLGVVLLEIGFWTPLSEVLQYLNTQDPSSWTEELSYATPELGERMGSKYQCLVEWCLGLTGRQLVKGQEFAQNVLDPLEEMADALS